MSDRSSPLTQRVRRLLGASAMRDDESAADLLTPLYERLDGIERRLSDLSNDIQCLRAEPTSDTEGVSQFKEALAGLEKQISRAGREQLKANSLAETQIELMQAAMEALRAVEERRNDETTALREQIRVAQGNARLDLVRAMFPIIDSLDEAIRSGERLLEQYAPLHTPTTLFERMRARMQPANREDIDLRAAMSSWLVGLTFVRQRMLDLLIAEGVHPIPAEGQPFDPHLHMVLDVVPSSPERPAGAIAAEIRRGYMHGNRVLRHAEVAVSGET